MQVVVEKGENLYEALLKQNIVLDRPCGGNGTCNGCKVRVERFGEVKACQFRLPGCYEVTLLKQQKFVAVGTQQISDLQEDLAQQPGWDQELSIAADIGTTTVVLCGFYKGKKLQKSFTNPQRMLGADVMSRIQNAVEGNADALRQLILGKLKESIGELVLEMCPNEKKCRLAIAANTTMIHLLCGWSCEELGRVPFHPVSLEKQNFVWRINRKDGRETECSVEILPGISAFVGADIVSGIYALSLQKKSRPVLLLDLGTNGEMALCTPDRIYTASAAAGPAFEGSTLAARIHAAGILKCLSDLLETGRMDETGLLAEPKIPVGEDVAITQDDVREIQMAKSAIRAGIQILLEKYGISADELEGIYLAGGMGYFIDPKDAVRIGLLPEGFLGNTRAVGNTALLGAERSLKEGGEHALKEMAQICERADEITLAQEPDFMELYIQNMNF